MGRSPIKLVHGIRRLPWRDNPMTPLLRELDERELPAALVEYGYVLVPVSNRRAVTQIKDQAELGCTLVGYSNGGWAVTQVAELGLPVHHLVLISPALHVGHAFPENVEHISVFFSKGDRTGAAARKWRWATRVMPWRWDNPHGWGAMMRDGYAGSDPRVRQFQMPDEVGHSWHQHRREVANIADRIEEVAGMRGQSERITHAVLP